MSALPSTPGYVGIYQEEFHDTRLIPTDGRQHIPQNIRQLQGDSVGHWEGDTLVVDVSSFNEETWFDRAGDFHSDALHVVERYTPRSPDTLTYEATIEDPKVFTRPWKMSMLMYRHLGEDARLQQFKCVEFVEELMYGDLRKEPLK